ncbi:hypothetical protein RJ639_044959 [Escallonia herrerae]|uniref:Reverse transcriptase Ty1/copia-type domain-containing protein n=1 Tax=Escallonia herrerae TaxID=1293975 RepID=A0AA88WBF4_9ASTE|nr:hypothetical protein RJ639_020345 [Escallonia herrerae]KAK3023574.1 hypothetical protein RJ639_044959 [Escallonia herrerae]
MEIGEIACGPEDCWLQMSLPEEGEKGYTKNAYDNCVYHQRLTDGSHIHLILYVDDMLIATKSVSDVNGLNKQLKREFEIKDLGCRKEDITDGDS